MVSDSIIMFDGLSPRLEGEEMKIKVDSFSGCDRTKIELPTIQIELLKELKATGKPVFLVLLIGSAIALPWVSDNISSINEAWYPDENGGNAITDVLFGDYNPGGCLAGEEKTIEFILKPKQLGMVMPDGKLIEKPSRINIYIES